MYGKCLSCQRNFPTKNVHGAQAIQAGGEEGEEFKKRITAKTTMFKCKSQTGKDYRKMANCYELRNLEEMQKHQRECHFRKNQFNCDRQSYGCTDKTYYKNLSQLRNLHWKRNCQGMKDFYRLCPVCNVQLTKGMDGKNDHDCVY